MSIPSIPLLFVRDWQASPSVCALTALAALLYVIAARRAGHWPLRRTLPFLLGLAAIVVALDSGLDTFDDQLLSVHMAQHVLLIDVAPPLLLCGRPALLALKSLPPRPRRSFGRGLVAARRLTTAPVCLAAYMILFIGWHIPGAFDAAVLNHTLHEAEHACYVLAGLLLWWPLLGDPSPSRRLTGVLQLPYLILGMLPMIVLGSYLDSTTALIYPVYGAPAHALGVSALADEHQAGAVMWVLGTTLMCWTGLGSIGSSMLLAERRQQERERREGYLREVVS